MSLLKFLASMLGVVTVLMLVCFVLHEKTKKAFEDKMTAYRRALRKAKQRVAQAQNGSELRVMSLRHQRALD